MHESFYEWKNNFDHFPLSSIYIWMCKSLYRPFKNYRYLTRMTKDSRKECKFFLQKNAKGSRLIAKVQNMRKFSGLLRLCRKLTTINDFVEIKFLTHQVHLQKTRKLTTICKVVRNVMENWNRSSYQNLLTNKNLK